MDEFRPEEISTVLRKRISRYKPSPIVYNMGTVATIGDGVVRVKNLPNRLYGELLEFESGAVGMALDLEEDGAGVVLMDSAFTVSEGDWVKGTGYVADVPVGDELLGRIIDPIGRALDGRALTTEKRLPVERTAPTIMQRRPIDKPLETGILAIDSMIPIGRGQRELIIGDRQTGKTSIAVDTILNQRDKDVICVYCAIGQKASSISKLIEGFKVSGALDYTVVVAATASDSPAMQYLAPYSATSIAESFMQEGKDVLIVYDDLSKHAVAYRTMSLLLHRPPGREAYPGDIFYLHSRLLERSAALSEELGGGSLTALPIIETMGGNISAYIPTNVISITDGQIYLETELFHSGIRPAVNTGLSVSRVGRAAQHKAMKRVSGSLRIELSQYREMAIFTRFGNDIDASTEKMLKKGKILTTLLVQQKGNPYSLFEQTALLTAYAMGSFDDAENIAVYSNKLINYLKKNCTDVELDVNRSGDYSEEDYQELKGFIEKFKENA